jgi:hypothetical protein
VSWDAHILRLDRPVKSIDDLPHEYTPPPLGDADKVRAAISESFPGTDWTDPSWGMLDGGEFSLEFSLGSQVTVASMGVHIHGSGDPVSPLLRMCSMNGWSALDVQTTELLDPQAPHLSSWSNFCAWRDRAIKG